MSIRYKDKDRGYRGVLLSRITLRLNMPLLLELHRVDSSVKLYAFKPLNSRYSTWRRFYIENGLLYHLVFTRVILDDGILC